MLYVINPTLGGQGGKKTGKRGEWGKKQVIWGKTGAKSFTTLLVNGFYFFCNFNMYRIL
jgi:hypothetical protein